MFESKIAPRTRMLAVILALLVSASTTSTAQIVNQSLIKLLSPAPIAIPQYGEPELMTAISKRVVVISSDKDPGSVSVIDFGAQLTLKPSAANPAPLVSVTNRASGSPNYDGTGQDTQIVRMANGKFLMSAPGAALSGGVSAQVMWRSSDGKTWDAATAIDSGIIGAADKSDKVQKGYCSKWLPGVGGFDRPELYAYPFSSAGKPMAFLTTLCSRDDDGPVVLFVSDDGGKTWGDSTVRLPGWTPAAMSASSKYLFIAQCVGKQVVLNVSEDRGKTLKQWAPWPNLKPQLDITTQGKPCSLDHDPGTHGNKFSLSAARTNDPNIVMVAYPTLEPIAGLPNQKRAVIEVVSVNVSDATVKVETTVRASSPTGSILHFSLIEDPRNQAPQNLSMLYWIETDRANPPLPKKPWTSTTLWPKFENTTSWPRFAFMASAKYMLLAGKNTYTAPALLSAAPWTIKYPQILADGSPAVPCPIPPNTKEWPYCAEQWYGDYMKGGSDVLLNTVDFAAAWAQCTAAQCTQYVQVVSVDTTTPLFKAFNSDTTVQWKKGVPTTAPTYDPKTMGPQLEPRRIKLERKQIKTRP